MQKARLCRLKKFVSLISTPFYIRSQMMKVTEIKKKFVTEGQTGAQVYFHVKSKAWSLSQFHSFKFKFSPTGTTIFRVRF